MKKLSALAAILLGVFVLAGCSGSSDEADDAPPPKGTVPSVQGTAPTPPGGASDGDGR